MNATSLPSSGQPDASDAFAVDDFERFLAADGPECPPEEAEADGPSAQELLAAAAAIREAARITLSDGQLAEWIDRIVDQDERALAALYDATVSRVYGIVLRVVKRPALAEEVVEDIYFQVWRQAVRFDAGRGRVLTWLLGMARSRAIDALRREARFVHASLDTVSSAEVEDEQAPPDEMLAAARGQAELHQALLLLNAQPRQLVAMAFFRGMSHEEIALQTCLPLGTVKSQIRRALITLRQLLGDGASPWQAC